MPKKILIIDDDPQIALALTTRLQAGGYQVVHAPNGLTGVDAASTQDPDAIILDVRMPDIDGYEACARIRQMPAHSDTPIIFLSAHSQQSFRTRATEAGGNLFLAKPYRASEVIDAIETLMHTCT